MPQVEEGKLEKIVQLLIGCGVQKNPAKTLACLLSSKVKLGAIEIESMTGMRQPEVSNAIRYLFRARWITREDEKMERKGRPRHLYFIPMTREQLLSDIQCMQKQRIKALENTFSELKKEILSIG